MKMKTVALLLLLVVLHAAFVSVLLQVVKKRR